MDGVTRYAAYLEALRHPFHKLARLRFLQPDGSTAFSLENDPRNARASAFISDGSVTHNWQNGRRTSASVTLSNLDGFFDYRWNRLWFGQEIALDEGLVLPDRTDFYIPQGVFLIESHTSAENPGRRTAQLSLVDKSAALDGTLGGTLEGTYQVETGTNIFTPISSLLAEDRGDGQPWDRTKPIFTDWYNGKMQLLPKENPDDPDVYVPLTDTPHIFTVDSTNGTRWSVVSGLCEMLNACVGYDEFGALRVDPSQDDILDGDKPVLWAFSMDEAELLGAAYKAKPTEVYNDYIVVGEALSDCSQPRGRAQIFDERSPCDIRAIGRKTIRVSKSGFSTDTQCRDYAEWMVKRSSVLQSAVTFTCSQMFHIRGNGIVTLARTDKPGSPIERHLVSGFTRPLASNGTMQITATSVNDFPTATVT